MKQFLSIILAIVIIHESESQDLTRFVNPFIGTSNTGNTNPGPVLPWGLVSLSPFNAYDTLNGAAWCPSPYVYGRKYISCFTHLHLSGVGGPELGTFSLMPTTGDISFVQSRNCSEYSNEIAVPGYYSVRLDRFHVKAELTTTTRTGISRYTFPKSKSNILLNLGLGLTIHKGAVIKRISDTEVEGFKSIGDFCGQSAVQTVYFVAKVSKTPKSCGLWSEDRTYPDFRREMAGNNIGAYFTFDTEENETISVKVGVSYVSTQNARINLETEQPDFDFDRTRIAAEKAWNKELSIIRVEGGSEEDRITFYSALYHILIHPNIYNDINNEYQIMESDKKATTNGSDRYTVFSLWDTYRNVHPLLSLVYPQKQSDMVKSLLGMYQESGWLPRWEYAGIDANTMSGDPALIVISDSYFRGIRDFDVHLAYEAMKHNATAPESVNYMRPGMGNWLKFGYIPDDAENVLRVFTSPSIKYEYENKRRLRIVWGSVSTSLEYCIADWNLAKMANALGKPDDYWQFYNRSMSYKNNYDSSTGFMRPKWLNGEWVKPFDPNNNKIDCFTEGSSWNYTFMAPHDIPGLMKLMGGPEEFIEKLNACFDKGFFDITNEPDLAYPYLYNYIKGQEWRTQDRVRDIIYKDFSNSPGGLPGNDDCGTMSAWLVFSMMGFYPACPGDMLYQIGSPLFSKVTISLDHAYYPGGTFVITARSSGKDNRYVQSMSLNGKSHPKFTIRHEDITKGGELVINMGNIKKAYHPRHSR